MRRHVRCFEGQLGAAAELAELADLLRLELDELVALSQELAHKAELAGGTACVSDLSSSAVGPTPARVAAWRSVLSAALVRSTASV